MKRGAVHAAALVPELEIDAVGHIPVALRVIFRCCIVEMMPGIERVEAFPAQLVLRVVRLHSLLPQAPARILCVRAGRILLANSAS